MKTKLLSALVITVLSIIGFSATADEVVDTSLCQVVLITRYVDNKYMGVDGLVCPHLGSGYFIYFYTARSRCVLTAVDYANYKATGTCTDFTLHRITPPQ